MVDVADTPAFTVAEVAAIVKSWTPMVKVAGVEWTRVPLVPVMMTVYVAAMVELQVSVAVPEFVTLVGVIAPQVRLAGTLSVSETVPVNPLSAVTVIVDVKLEPAPPEGDVAATVKSVKFKFELAE
jgi:hypothetical protein